jgi:hypothetical protein
MPGIIRQYTTKKLTPWDNSRTASQEIPRLLWNHDSLSCSQDPGPMVPILEHHILLHCSVPVIQDTRTNLRYFDVKKVLQHTYGGAGGGRYRSYSFTASALDRGEWSASRPVRALAQDPRYPLDRRLGGPQSRSGHRG